MARQRRRLGALLVLLSVSGLLFVLVVSWQRDQSRIKATMDAAGSVAVWTQGYLDERGHLPFELPRAVTEAIRPWEVPYPSREDIYRLDGLLEPFMLLAGPRQGLLLRKGGCSTLLYQDKKVRAVWLTWDEVEQERDKRTQLLAGQQPAKSN